MKAILVLALIVLAANAIDGEAYYQGFTQKLGLSSSDVQVGRTCFETLIQQVGQLNSLLQGSQSTVGGEGTGNFGGEGNFGGQGTGSGPNIEQLFSTLLDFYGQAQGPIQSECGPFIGALTSSLAPNMRSPSMQDLPEGATIADIVSINWNWYFPQIIQQFGQLVNQLNTAQDLQAGMTNAYILQILFGNKVPQTTPATNVVLGQSVPFNQKNFMNQFFTGFFKTLGFKTTDVTNNVKSINTCVIDTIPRLITIVTNFQTQISKLSVLESFYATKGFYSNLISTFKNCKGAYTVLDTISKNIQKQVGNSQTNGLYQIFLNSALNFPQIENTIMQEANYIDQGKYELAGNTEAQRWKTIFNNVVNFAL